MAGEEKSSPASRLQSKGASVSWKKGKAAALKKFEAFRTAVKDRADVKQDLDLSKPFQELHPDVLCHEKLWELFAGWLAKDYKKSSREPLAPSTVKNTVGAMLNAAKAVDSTDATRYVSTLTLHRPPAPPV